MNCRDLTLVLFFLLFVFNTNTSVLGNPGSTLPPSDRIKPGNIFISSQGEVDAFKTAHISGNLIIRGKDITNLNGLRSLRSVEGSVIIEHNPLLTSLKGLSSLTTVGNTRSGGSITIRNNKSLNSVHMPALQFIYGGLHISKNDALVTIDGTGALTTVASLEIVQNKALKNIRNFSSLSEIGLKTKGLPTLIGVLEIKGNNALVNIEGFSALRQIAGGLYGRISIEKNENLRNIDGLRSLRSIDGVVTVLHISNNKKLQHIDGLSRLSSMGKASSVILTGNPSLTRCCGLFALLSTDSPRVVKISRNGAGCSAKEIREGGKCEIVCHESIVLSSQLQIDAFPNTYGCSTVKGSLTISGSDIAQVDGLVSISSISGSLSIMDNPALTSLNGLTNLTWVGQGNKNGDVTITHNTLLQNLDGLSGLKKVSNQLAITDNKTLEQIDALSSLQEVNGLKIANNPALRNISGLHALGKVGTGRYGEFSIINNDALTELYGLSNIQSIEGNQVIIKITDNDQLFDLEGLSGLRSVRCSNPIHFEISNNAVLTNLFGIRLLHIMDSPHSRLVIKNNTALSACCGLYNLLFNDPPETIEISGNAGDCTTEGILAAGRCAGLCFNIELHTQSEVDDFPRLYGCTHALNLIVEGNDIRNVDGLKSLSVIDGSIHIRNNPVLSDIDGLSALKRVGGFTPVDQIRITDNHKLADINGLSSLSVLFGGLYLDNNKNLRNIDGLSSVKEIFGGVTISNHRALSSLNGLSNVNAIYTGRYSEGIALINNDALTEIDGLSALTTVSGYRSFLTIIDNDRLTDLDGLSSLASLDAFIQAGVRIVDNNRLKNLDGLSSVQVPGYLLTELNITDNVALNLCCGVYKIASSANPAVVSISGNGPVCTFEEIVRAGGPCIVAAETPADAAVNRFGQDIYIYPNPNQGRFNLLLDAQTASSYRLVIKDLAGNSVREAIIVNENGQEDIPIDVRPLPKGIYMVTIHNSREIVATERLVVTE